MLMCQLHLTAISLTLLGQGPGILRPIWVFFGIWTTICRDPVPLLVEALIIITVKSETISAIVLLLQNKKCFTHYLYYPPMACRLPSHIRLLPPPLPPPALFLASSLLLLTENKQNT